MVPFTFRVIRYVGLVPISVRAVEGPMFKLLDPDEVVNVM
jgi:hypothetical protein